MHKEVEFELKMKTRDRFVVVTVVSVMLLIATLTIAYNSQASGVIGQTGGVAAWLKWALLESKFMRVTYFTIAGFYVALLVRIFFQRTNE
jgi:hypothetical protein